MTWLVWRRQRGPLLVALGLIALLAAVAVIGGLRGRALAATPPVAACLATTTAGPCVSPVWLDYVAGYTSFVDALWLAGMAVPAVAGAVVGAALFGDELARGTQVFALTQSVSRLRWWAGGLLVSGLPVALAVGLGAFALDWATDPMDGIDPFHSPLSPREFLTTGVVPVAYAVLAFCLASAAGLLLRSTVAALGVALAVQVAVLGLVLTVRSDHYYLPPDLWGVDLESTATAGGQWYWGSGESLVVESGYLDDAGRWIPVADVRCAGTETSEAFLDCARRNGLNARYLSYQPDNRYWVYQTLDSQLVLVLAAGALAAGYAGVRRRVH